MCLSFDKSVYRFRQLAAGFSTFPNFIQRVASASLSLFSQRFFINRLGEVLYRSDDTNVDWIGRVSKRNVKIFFIPSLSLGSNVLMLK